MSIDDGTDNQKSNHHNHLSKLNNTVFKPMSRLSGPYTYSKTSLKASPNHGVKNNNDRSTMNLTSSVGLIDHRSRISALVGQSQELKNIKLLGGAVTT